MENLESDPLLHLMPVQREAAKYFDGPMMISAGAGSGKTRTIMAKIATFCLQEKKAKILGLTFSNKAAKEMRHRLELPPGNGLVILSTFHAFCSSLLRREAHHLGLDKNFTIFDRSDSKALAKKVLEQSYKSSPTQLTMQEKGANLNAFLAYVDELKNLGHYPSRKQELEKAPINTMHEYYSLFCHYEQELLRSGSVDFGGIITWCLKLFEETKGAIEHYEHFYDYILIDEYQDTNRAQFDLLAHLTKKKGKVCVVGDDDQSIYSWRGAELSNIKNFFSLFPQAKLFKLEQNFRSTQNIIKAASAVIALNEERTPKEMFTENDEGENLN